MLIDNAISRQKVINGITYHFDTYRYKWLSIDKFCISYGINHRNISCSRWLSVVNGIYSNNIGFRAPRLSTITTVIPQSKNQSMCAFNVIRIDNILVTATLNNEEYKIVNTNVDFDENEFLKCYLEVDNGHKVDFPFVVLECAYRLP